MNLPSEVGIVIISPSGGDSETKRKSTLTLPHIETLLPHSGETMKLIALATDEICIIAVLLQIIAFLMDCELKIFKNLSHR